MISRDYYKRLLDELIKDHKMVLVSGPRQSGKTTFIQDYAKKFSNSYYFNWDSLSHKRVFASDPYFFEKMDRRDDSLPIVIFDEIHKYKKWKNYLKGVYDDFSGDYLFVVTGSGRLDISQRGGDALSGRFFQMNLFPFTLSELSKHKMTLKNFIGSPLQGFDINPQKETRDIWETLSNFGGFPEPFIRGEERFLRRWSEAYTTQIIRDDIRNMLDLKNIDTIEILVSILPSKVGSPLSINNIASDLQVSFETVKNWLRILDAFYIIFSISTWTKKVSRSILKERKLYLFNYPDIEDSSIRFENMIALELYKTVRFLRNGGYGNFDLHYLRTKDKEEVDFLISLNNKPLLLIEAKFNETDISKSLLKFQRYFNVPAIQLVNREDTYRVIRNKDNSVLIVTAHRWLSALPFRT